MDTPSAVPLTFEEDVAPLGMTYRIDFLKDLEALRPSVGLRIDEPAPPLVGARNPHESPPPDPRSTDPLHAFMTLQP